MEFANTTKEINEIQIFLETEKLKNTKYKLFTNDLNVLNLWLFNYNKELTISDGFTNSLSNSQIEFNLINNLKDFQISENLFKEIFSFNKSELRISLFIFILLPISSKFTLYIF